MKKFRKHLMLDFAVCLLLATTPISSGYNKKVRPACTDYAKDLALIVDLANGVKRISVPEGMEFSMSCSIGEVLEVVELYTCPSLFNPTGFLCTDEITHCKSLTQFVKNTCGGRQSCPIAANDGLTGDLNLDTNDLLAGNPCKTCRHVFYATYRCIPTQ